MFGKKGGTGRAASTTRQHPSGFGAEVNFDITPSAKTMILSIIFFGVCALVLFKKVMDPGGVLINRLIELGPFGADILYGTLFVASLGFVAIATYQIVLSFGKKVFISLDDHAIVGPRWYGNPGEVKVDFTSIRDIEFSQISNSEFIVIHTNDGRKIRVGNKNFRIASEWAQFLDEFRARVGSRFSGN